jgi:transposase InsO family protein
VVGWTFGESMTSDLVINALNMALLTRKPESVIHHSDQGSQYTSIAFGNRCKEMGVRPSMGTVPVVRANQVWSTDITYVRLDRGFAYLVAVIDWYSRRVLSWRISNSMEAAFCVDCLEDALRAHGKPEVFNSDQGSQFTSDDFTNVLKREDIAISMDGRGRAYDNIFVERLWRSVKHEDVYLNGYSAMGELLIGLTKYFAFYNTERPHQSLGNLTPQEVHKTSSGGGAMIVDKYRAKERLPVALRSSGTEFEEVRIESESAIPIAKTGAAPSSCETSSAT